MNNRKYCRRCAMMNEFTQAESPIKEVKDLSMDTGTLIDQLFGVRAAAEAVRNSMNNIIVRTNELLEVLDEANWDFGDEEEDE